MVKEKVNELEEEIREEFLRRLRKDLTDVFQVFSGKRRFLVRFQDGCEKDLTLNQLTVMTVDDI